MDGKGFILTKELIHTNYNFYKDVMNFSSDDFKNAIEKKILKVLDIAVDNSGYLVLVNDKITGQYLIEVDARDVKLYLPIERFGDYLIPINLSIIEKIKWIIDIELNKEVV